MSFRHKAQESIDKAGTFNARVQLQHEFVPAFDGTLEYRKAAPTASLISLDRLPQPATEYDYFSGLTSFNPVGLTSPHPVGYSGIHLLWTGQLRAPSLPIPGVSFGGLVPRIESTASGDSCPAPPAQSLVSSCPSPKAPSWVGSCLALTMMPCVSSLAPRLYLAIFEHTSHV